MGKRFPTFALPKRKRKSFGFLKKKGVVEGNETRGKKVNHKISQREVVTLKKESGRSSRVFKKFFE